MNEMNEGMGNKMNESAKDSRPQNGEHSNLAGSIKDSQHYINRVIGDIMRHIGILDKEILGKECVDDNKSLASKILVIGSLPNILEENLGIRSSITYICDMLRAYSREMVYNGDETCEATSDPTTEQKKNLVESIKDSQADINMTINKIMSYIKILNREILSKQDPDSEEKESQIIIGSLPSILVESTDIRNKICLISETLGAYVHELTVK